MKVSEQADAMEVSAIKPFRSLKVTRVYPRGCERFPPLTGTQQGITFGGQTFGSNVENLLGNNLPKLYRLKK